MMDFAAFTEQLKELMPEDFRPTAQVLKFIEEVQYNVDYLAPEIYDPKNEIRTYLKELASSDEPWVQSALVCLDAA